MNKLPSYRADVDGLRAVAVMAVVGFHAFPAYFPGGFVGVDVFFVISGFLISMIIFEGLKHGDFDYLDFYVRRVRRIFPALVVVLLASLGAGAAIAFPDDFRQLGKQAFGGAAFVSNLLFARGEGYFHPSAELQPLLHLWSLAIEEQFYLLWPVTAALLYKSQRALAIGMLVLAVASLAAAIFLTRHHQSDLAFYLPVSRFWELLMGAGLAWVSVFRARLDGIKWIFRFRHLFAAAGTSLVLSAVFLISREEPFPGWLALLPTTGTALLLLSGPHSWVNSRLLRLRPLVLLGLISYPLYLWHWPILSFLRMVHGELGWAVKAAAVVVSIVLAWATYRYVEHPIRFGPWRKAATAPACAAIAAIAVSGLGIRYGFVDNGGLNEKALFVSAFENNEPKFKYFMEKGVSKNYRFDCDFHDWLSNKAKDRIERSCFVTERTKSILIWGDSFAQSLYHGLETAIPGEFGILQVATSGCRPAIVDVHPDPFGACNKSNRFALDVVRNQKPDVVLLTQRQHHEQTDWDRISKAVLGAGAKHVLVVGPLPEWRPDLHRIVAREYWADPPARILKGLVRSKFETDQLMKKSKRTGASYELVSPMDRLCDASGCITYVGADRIDDLIVFDSGHLTARGSEWIGREILVPAIQRLIERDNRQAASGRVS